MFGVGGFKYSWEIFQNMAMLSWECLDNLKGSVSSLQTLVTGFTTVPCFQAAWVTCTGVAILTTKGPLKPTGVDGEIEEMLAASIVTMKPQVKRVDGGAICCAFKKLDFNKASPKVKIE